MSSEEIIECTENEKRATYMDAVSKLSKQYGYRVDAQIEILSSNIVRAVLVTVKVNG